MIKKFKKVVHIESIWFFIGIIMGTLLQAFAMGNVYDTDAMAWWILPLVVIGGTILFYYLEREVHYEEIK